MEIPQKKLYLLDRLTEIAEKHRHYPQLISKDEVLKSDHLFDFCLFAARMEQQISFIVDFPALFLTTTSESEKQQLLSFIFPLSNPDYSESDDEIFDVHVFASKCHENPVMFGVCIHINPNEGNPIFFNTPLPEHLDEIVICFLTATPQIETLIKVGEFILEISKGKEVLDIEDNNYTDKYFNPFIFNFLQNLYSYEVSLSSKEIKINNFSVNIHPFKANEMSFINPGLDILFSNLSLKDIVGLYSALLLEESIIITGDSLFEISSVVLCLIALLLPLKIATTILPILPDRKNFNDIYETPFPMIIGSSNCNIHSGKYFVDNINIDDFVIVDLKQKSLHRKETVIVPNSNALIKNLSKILACDDFQNPKKKFFIRRNSSTLELDKMISIIENTRPFLKMEERINPKYLFNSNAVNQILQAFHESINFCFNESIMMSFVQCLSIENSQTIKIFMRDLFLKFVINDENEEFVNRLINTQMFDVYISSIIKTI